MSKLSIVELKKHLNKKSKATLIQEIADLAKKFKPVKEFYAAQVSPADIQKILEEYKNIIEKEFIEGKTRGMPKLRFSVARKALNDFKKINNDPIYLVDLMLCYAGAVSDFSSTYGPRDEKFYTVPETLYEEALQLAKKFGIEQNFKETAREIMEGSCEEWSHQDSLSEVYEEIYED